MKKIVFIIPPLVELLDLAGPAQVFAEAKYNGLNISIEFYSFQPGIISATGLPFGKLENYKKARLSKGDFVFIPGINFGSMERSPQKEKMFFKWLSQCAQRAINICSVCNAAFILGEAGLLDNKECTTHWRSVDMLQERFPRAIVLTEVLFVRSDNIYTSAGISSGIDLALSILEELTDPFFVNKVSRGLVIYHRRSSKHSQQSTYLDYRNHINPRIHQVQDYLMENMNTQLSIEKIAGLVCMSPRNLSRVFKDATQITILDYVTRLRLEKARTLKNNPAYTIGQIASECGFKSARQLQRILKSVRENEK